MGRDREGKEGRQHKLTEDGEINLISFLSLLFSPCVCVFPITEGMNFSLENNFRYMFIFKNDVYNYYPCF